MVLHPRFMDMESKTSLIVSCRSNAAIFSAFPLKTSRNQMGFV